MLANWLRAQILHDLNAVAAACQAAAPDVGLGPDFSLPEGDAAFAVLERLQLLSLDHDSQDAAAFALAFLLAEATRGRRGFVMDARDWQDHAAFIRALPPPRRAVLMRAWHILNDGYEELVPALKDAEMRGLDRADVMAPLIALAKGMSEAEIATIAAADYGMDIDSHTAALREVLAHPECRFPRNDRWYPAEVVELVAHCPGDSGGVRCTALCILDDIHNNADYDQMTFRWGRHSADYIGWPPSVGTPILRGVRYLYESAILGPWGFQFPKTARPIPWFDG